MNNPQPEPEAISTAKNNSHVIKQERSLELEELITYLVNYLKPLVLSDLQEKVLRGAWQGKTYTEISQETHNDPDYLKGVGASLWKILSEALSEEVTKRNLKLVAKRNYEKLKSINQNFQQVTINIPKVTNLTPQIEKTCNKTVTNKYRVNGIAIDVSLFYGRTQELATLEKWIVRDRCRLVSLLGMGGIGKTSLAAKLVRQIESQFEFIIWKSLHNAPELKNLLAELILTVGDRQNLWISDNVEDQIDNLMNCFRKKRCLLIFDGVENILESEKLRGQYLDLYQNYGQLLKRIQDEQHQSCVLITSREKPTGFSLREGKKSAVRSLHINGLSLAEAEKIFQARGIIDFQDRYRQLVKQYSGNPLALKTVAATVQSIFIGNVTAFLNQEIVIFGDIWEILDQQFKRMSSLEQQILHFLAMHGKSITITELHNYLGSRLSKRLLLEALCSLQGRSLIETSIAGFTLQSIVRQHIIESLDYSPQILSEQLSSQSSKISAIANG